MNPESESPGEQIYRDSMERIRQEGPDLSHYSPGKRRVIARVIHATGDFAFEERIIFRGDPIAVFQQSMGRQSPLLFSDTNMALAGLRSDYMEKTGVRDRCYISAPEVARRAKENQQTRAETAVRFAGDLLHDEIVLIAMTPTALDALMDLMKNNNIKPSLIIATPVGFIGAERTKEDLLQIEVPQIQITGRWGGTPAGASIVNALLSTYLKRSHERDGPPG